MYNKIENHLDLYLYYIGLVVLPKLIIWSTTPMNRLSNFPEALRIESQGNLIYTYPGYSDATMVVILMSGIFLANRSDYFCLLR